MELPYAQTFEASHEEEEGLVLTILGCVRSVETTISVLTSLVTAMVMITISYRSTTGSTEGQ